MTLTADGIRNAFAVLVELNRHAQRIIQTYFTVAQPGGYASSPRMDSVTDDTVTIRYDWTNCGTEEEWETFPLQFIFLNDADLQEQMKALVTHREELRRIERERDAASAARKHEEAERRQLAALKAKYEPPEPECNCNGGEQGDGLSALPHEPGCPKVR